MLNKNIKKIEIFLQNCHHHHQEAMIFEDEDILGMVVEIPEQVGTIWWVVVIPTTATSCLVTAFHHQSIIGGDQASYTMSRSVKLSSLKHFSPPPIIGGD